MSCWSAVFGKPRRTDAEDEEKWARAYQLGVDAVASRLHGLRPLVERVAHQTRARLLGGDTHVPDKVPSLFEPHPTTIREGKISKPIEFGNLVTIQESEQGA